MNPILALIIANLVWGAASPIFKLALTNIPPFTLAFIRFSFAAVLFLPFIKLFWKKINFQELLEVLLVGVFGITINISFFFLGLPKTTSINAPIIASSGPIFIYLLSILFLRERPKAKILFGMLTALIGVLIIILSPIFLEGKRVDFGEIEGNIFFLIATFGTVMQTIISKDTLKKVNPYQATFISFIFGALTFFPLMIKELRIWEFSQLNNNGILGIVFSIFSLFKKFDIRLLIILLSFFVIFIPHTLLFAKWTRFIAPVFPFFSIFSIYFISSIPNKFNFLKRNLVYLLCLSTSIWSLMFFSIYLKPDVRRTADNWVNSNLPVDSTYLLESGNTIDLPLSSKNKISLDFYNLENDTATKEKIINTLTEYNYFIIQSRRVFMNHQRLPNLYPKTAKFYAALFSGILGFGEIKEFHSYPAIPIPGITLEFPDESAEETWSVFDHPVIRIYQKNVRYSREDYAKILED